MARNRLSKEVDYKREREGEDDGIIRIISGGKEGDRTARVNYDVWVGPWEGSLFHWLCSL